MLENNNRDQIPDRPYANAKFYWKYEYNCVVGASAWILRIKDRHYPQIAIFPKKPRKTSPKVLADFTTKAYNINYDQVFYWKSALLGGDYVSVFRPK